MRLLKNRQRVKKAKQFLPFHFSLVRDYSSMSESRTLFRLLLLWVSLILDFSLVVLPRLFTELLLEETFCFDFFGTDFSCFSSSSTPSTCISSLGFSPLS